MKHLSVFLLCLLLTVTLFAQTNTEGTILGIVTDPSGAAVPGAAITVFNVSTGLKWPAVADSSGAFQVLPLPRGIYRIQVDAAGFGSLTLENIDLAVGETKRVPVHLEVGKVAESVSVASATNLLQTDTAEVTTTVDERQIKELPVNGRDPIALVSLAPGILYSGKTTFDQAETVAPAGMRNDQTEFSLDGMNAMVPTYEQGTGFPDMDSVAEFNVQTANFSAANGRNPVQVNLVSKSGTNQFHGSLWEFLRNNDLDARNWFAVGVPKLDYNQFGGTIGGPIWRNKTFFFFSYEGIRIDQQAVQTDIVPSAAQWTGVFPGTITDPLTGQPFPNNTIPSSRINSSSSFFHPYFLQANSPDGLYHNILPNPERNGRYFGRLDHQITSNQRIYGRVVEDSDVTDPAQYSPSLTEVQNVNQYNVAVNYDYTIKPKVILSVGGSTLYSNNHYTSPQIGMTNYTDESGIVGFPTAGRAAFVGLPNIGVGQYTGITVPNAPYHLVSEGTEGLATLNFIIRQHTLTGGAEYFTYRLTANHGSCCVRGDFGFNGQYTGDAFADYLLGYPDFGGRNLPLDDFGLQHEPFDALFIQDSWKISPKLTAELGLRWEYWGHHAFVRGAGGTFDPTIGKAVAGENKHGQVDLGAQATAPALAAATAGLWVPASQVGYPRGLYIANGVVQPRLGVAWRPTKSGNLVVRGSYGLFASNLDGNGSASSIVGPPYWAYELPSFGLNTLQNWQTIFPAVQTQFVTPAIYAPAVNARAQQTREWNISVQQALPYDSALTVSYVGNNSPNLISLSTLDVVPPGNYPNLQAALPYPAFGVVDLYNNISSGHYNAAVITWTKRYSHGVSGSFNYNLSRNILNNSATAFNPNVGNIIVGSFPTPFAPPGYNNGRALNDNTHIISANFVWNLPFGRNQTFGSSISPILDVFLGGWEVTGIYQFVSGDPLTFNAPGNTLGNGFGTRANVVGNPHVGKPSAAEWFNPSAFATPPLYTFGTSGIGILNGPAHNTLDMGLLKNFHIYENASLQFRWEIFNSLNNVNFSDPNTTTGQPGSTGVITSAGDPRIMQLALKLMF
jgi:hypothetical protein